MREMQMTAAYLLSAVLGIVVFFIASKISLPLRLGLSLGTFLVLAVIAMIVISRIGDRAPPDAVTVDLKQLQDGGKDKGPTR